MGETHLLVEPKWQSRFAQSHARDGGGPITVARVRQWIDSPSPMGLPVELQNLIILTWAAQTNRRFLQRGGPFEPSIDSLPEDLELREQALPDSADWDLAVRRAASLFGLTLGQTLNAANVGRLVDDVRRAASQKREVVGRLVAAVRDRAGRYAPGQTGARQQTIESAQALLASLSQAAEVDVVKTLATTALMTSEAAVGRALGQAQACVDALDAGAWQLFDTLRDLQDHRREVAAAITERLREALDADEHVLPLKAKLEELARDAMRLLAAAAPQVTTLTPTPVPTPVHLPPVNPAPTVQLVEEKQQIHLSGSEAAATLDELKGRLAKDEALELTLSWRLERKSAKP
jgi:hypothetical protein